MYGWNLLWKYLGPLLEEKEDRMPKGPRAMHSHNTTKQVVPKKARKLGYTGKVKSLHPKSDTTEPDSRFDEAQHIRHQIEGAAAR